MPSDDFSSSLPHSARILDGKSLAAEVRADIRARASSSGIVPGLAVIRVGNDPASETYVRAKIRACAEVGFHSREIHLSENTSEEQLLSEVSALNADPAIHGILVQLPLPAHLSGAEKRVTEAILPEKDADGFHPLNMGRLFLGLPGPVPCTPKGILRILDAGKIPIAGRHAVVVGRSNIVGKPVSQLLLARNATVTVCHSKTPDLPSFVRQADILVAAVGRPGLIQPGWIKPGAALIDVGITRGEDGRLHGDIDPACARLASAMTPVPGGVGPMTVAMLLENTLELALKFNSKNNKN